MFSCFSASEISVYAQSNSPRGLRGLNLQHGLSDLLVNVIYKDSRGFMWFGTESGVDRFDGYKVLSYPIKSADMRSKRVFAITEGQNGTIYVGTNQGLYSILPYHSQLNGINSDELNFNINALAADGKGTLFIGSRHGLYLYNEETGKMRNILPDKDNFSDANEIIGLELDGSQGLWLISKKKIYHLSLMDDRLQEYPLPINVKPTVSHRVGDFLYVGTDGEGITPFNIKTGKYGEPIKLGNGIVTAISELPGDEVAVSTDGEGIFIYSPNERIVTDRFTSSDQSPLKLRSNSVYSTLVDNNGLFWIGYYQSGVDYTPQTSKLLSLYTFPGLPEPHSLTVRALSIEGDYKLIGTHDGLFLINETAGTIKKYETPQIDSNLIFTILPWNGEFYFGTYHGGMYRLNPATGSLSKVAAEQTGNKTIFVLEKDSRGNMWAAASDGLYKFEPGNPNPVLFLNSSNSQLPSGSVYEIFFDSLGRGWICTENGMAIWNGTRVSTTDFPKGFINNMKIRHIFEDSSKTLFFLPDRGNIWYSDLSLSKFGEIDQTLNSRFSAANFILEDSNHWLWIGTDNGLFRYDKKNKFNIFNNTIEGINPSYTHGTPHIDKNGNLWMGSTNGLQRLDLSLLEKELARNSDSRLSITEVASHGMDISSRLKIDGKEMKIELQPDESDISVRLSNFQYNPPEYFELEVLCEGIDETWKRVDGNQDLRYYELKPGTYTLRIRQPGNPDSEISLEIHRPSGLAWLWSILIGLTITGTIALFIVVAMRRKHNRELEQMIAENRQKHEDSKENAEEKEAAYKTTRISDEECKRIFRKLESVMKSEKPYTDTKLKSSDLAAMAGTSTHALSFLFNQFLHKSFYDYINEYRVEEFKRIVSETDTSKYTLTTVAERCGFSSRASFFRHFKAITGMTPSEYLKKTGV